MALTRARARTAPGPDITRIPAWYYSAMASGVIEEWHPVTYDYGLIHAPIDEVVRTFLDWQASLGLEHSLREITTDLATGLRALPPLSAGKRRRLFVATESEWVGCFQSGIDGSDPFPAMSFLAGRMQVLAMRVCSTPEGSKWPATIWEVYAPESLGGRPPLHYRRAICAANDGGRWVFGQSGDPYEFENLAIYDRPRKRDRFTRQVLQEYLAHFDIDAFADDFFVVSKDSPALLLERPARANEPPEFDLEEVIAGAPWKKR